ncbi:MAG: hypothetical protein LH603_16395 [Pseudonocardia sp.]|nr:hypothetical protein [Pseudonocardia sp.]
MLVTRSARKHGIGIGIGIDDIRRVLADPVRTVVQGAVVLHIGVTPDRDLLEVAASRSAPDRAEARAVPPDRGGAPRPRRCPPTEAVPSVDGGHGTSRGARPEAGTPPAPRATIGEDDLMTQPLQQDRRGSPAGAQAAFLLVTNPARRCGAR